MSSQGSIFISYRREDSPDVTGRIYDRLVGEFGGDAVFKDVDDIPLGKDFRKHLNEEVSRCQILLAVIGTKWVNCADGNGNKRLDNQQDFVRIEIEAALNRDIPVIPLLVSGAAMPSSSQLPECLSSLIYRNGIQIRRDPDFHRDMDRLIKGIPPLLGLSAQTKLTAQHETPAKDISDHSQEVTADPKYEKLEELLQNQQWKEADQETYRLMITIMGRTEGDYFREKDLKTFLCEDLQTLDRLWVKYSKGKWGFSVQKRIWEECGSPRTYNDDWEKFGDRVGWRKNSEWLGYKQLTFDLQKTSFGEFPRWFVGGFSLKRRSLFLGIFSHKGL
ncbi:GUN4 domain-containing protein [Acaryochloris marina]|uniref:GUN4 domain-containing protein n=1 Tax=Acaryochloris marina TaxID=155978 RepID=UPI002016CCBA|nr:GUN4 domain-containing protein [Acaryochloris marina]